MIKDKKDIPIMVAGEIRDLTNLINQVNMNQEIREHISEKSEKNNSVIFQPKLRNLRSLLKCEIFEFVLKTSIIHLSKQKWLLIIIKSCIGTSYSC
jgi:hypothetical protein